jgi:thiol:disulfide interchange protein
MKKVLLLAILILVGHSADAAQTATKRSCISSRSVATESGIRFFEGTWQEALAQAKKENKLIFLDAYASWCGPCKIMAKRTFPNEDVGAFFNKNFINYKMDMEKHPEGPRLSRELYLTSYPTLYFLRSTEKPIHRTSGLLKPKQLISAGKRALKNKHN